jgi:type I restriction enzyme S subunit
MTSQLATKRLKFCDRLFMGQSPDGATVSSDGEGIWFLQGNADFGDLHPTPKSRTTQPEKLCRTGDILLSVRAPVGAVNVADQDYAIGRGLCAIRPLEHDRRFLRYLLTTQSRELNSVATGTTFTAVSVQQVGNLSVAAPSPNEQQRIAAYLDEATGKIDRLVSLRRHQMKLLREQRAALIQQAVTRGLNPHAPLKDSGLPWIG